MLDWPPAKEPPAFTTVAALHVFLSPSVREASPETCEPGAVRPDQKQSPSPASTRQTQSKTPRQPFAWRCLSPRVPSNPQGSTPEHALTSPKNKIKMATKIAGRSRNNREICSCKPATPNTLAPIKTKPDHVTQNTDWLNSSVMEGSAAIRST